MAEKIVSTLKGKIKFEMDKSSLSRVKRTIKRMKDDLKGINGVMGMGGGGRSGSSRTNRPQKNFEEYQKRTIKNFLISNKQVRSLADSEKDRLREVLKQAKTREELQDLMKRERAVIQDRLAEERRITKEKQKQNVIQRRITGSTEQMVGALGSAFVAVEAFQSVVNTGMKFEAFEKTFLAVSKNTEEAKENMEFARKIAMEMGADIVESGKAYARMLGGKGNTPLETVRDTFEAVSKATTAMGLSADDQMGVYRAFSQILSKQKFTAEEVQNQIADRGLPAIDLLRNAALSLGMDAEGGGINKLMERGELTVEKILPAFNKQLELLANNNNAYSKAVKENFAPALGRATNTLKMLSNEIFEGGLKDGLLFVLNSFTDLGSESKNLARTIGSVLGGAVVGLTFPFKMLYAIVYDVANFFGVDLSNSMIQSTSAILGMAASVFVLVKMFRWLFKSKKALSGLGDMIDTPDGKSKRSGKKKGKVGKPSNIKVAAAYLSTYLPDIGKAIKNATIASGSMLKSGLTPKAGLGVLGALAPSSVATGTLDNQQTNGLSQSEAIDKLTQQLSQGNKIAIELNMNENAESFIDARVVEIQQGEYEGVFETNGGSKD